MSNGPDILTLRAISVWLAEFENKRCPLHQLVVELTVLQDGLTGVSAAWLEEFDRLRFSLEEANALALDGDRVALGDKYAQFVHDAVTKLREFVDRAE